MKIAIFLGLLVISLAHLHFEIEGIDMETTDLSVESKTFDNLKDHFGDRQLGTFKSRYWELNEFDDPGSPPKAILYICGESEGRFPAENTLPLLAAERAKAIVFSLEHRFYGESQPTQDWSTKNLELLTFQQGLADIAYFIELKNKEFKEERGVAAKWVVIGGSYAGAMSAWFRYKYPHLAVGSISSSGVINAIDDFYGYEEQVIEDLKHCDQKVIEELRMYQAYSDEVLYSNDKEALEKYLAIFKAADMNQIDFPYYFADIPVTWIQRGLRNDLCDLIMKISNLPDIDEKLSLLAEEAAKQGHTTDSYKMSTLRDIKYDPKKNTRQWYYQVCTTFGWFQTPVKSNPIRSANMNITYWQVYCSEMFPEKKLFPNTIYTNYVMGGLNIANHTSNTFFTQGNEDGWRNAGLNKDLINDRITVKEIDCPKCAHCSDLKAAKEDDHKNLKKTREEEIEIINKWLS